MKLFFKQLAFLFLLVCALKAQDQPTQQTRMMNSKIKEYADLMTLDPATISTNCNEVNVQYHKAIEAYDFLSTFTLDVMQETLQNIGKLKTFGNDLEQEATATFEQLAHRDQLYDTRNQHRLEELQWRVNWSSNAKSSEVPVDQINTMREEITDISGDKQKELNELIQNKTDEQSQLTEQIQLGESSYNKLNADKKDLNAVITVLNDKLASNIEEMNETMQANSTRGDKLSMLQLKLKFFEDKKKVANSFDSIKQLSQLSMRTEEEINEMNNDIELANKKVVLLQESNAQLKDTLTTKKAEIREVELQLDNVNTQLLQIKHKSEELTSFVEQKKQEQQNLQSQLLEKDNKFKSLKDISKLEQKLSIQNAKHEYLNQKLLQKQNKMKELQQESQKNSLQLELTQIQKDLIELDSQTQATKQELKYQRKLSEQQISFLQLSQDLQQNPQQLLEQSEKELQRAQEKVKDGKNRVERLERQEEMYKDSYTRAQNEIMVVNAKLATADDIQKEALEDQLKRLNDQYQKEWSNYVEQKEELVKEKKLLVTFENFESSIESDLLKAKEEMIEGKKEEQEKREEEIQRKDNELENKLKVKEQQKGAACAIRVDSQIETQAEAETEAESEVEVEVEEGPIVIPNPKPTGEAPSDPLTQAEQTKNKQESSTTNSDQPVPEDVPSDKATDDVQTKQEQEKIIQNEKVTEQKQTQMNKVSQVTETKEVTQSTISPEAQKELDKAAEGERRGKVVNEIEELIKQYEHLITIKETYLEEKLKEVVEKEEVVIKHEFEIKEAAEKIKVEVQKCKQEKRQIIESAKEEKESQRERLAERDAKSKLDNINKQLKDEFLKEGEIFKKKQALEEQEEEVRQKQAILDKKVEDIEKKIFKDVPAPKQSELIRVDVGGMRAPTPSESTYIRVSGSKIPLAYPWTGDHYIATKDEVIVPQAKKEQELEKEEVNIDQQEKKAEETKEAIKEQEQSIQKEQKAVELKEYKIEQKEMALRQKSMEVNEQLGELDQEIARCKLIFSSGDEESQDFQMCQSQFSDYEAKKQKLEEMKEDYMKQLEDFTREKEEFYSKQASNLMTSFAEVSIELGKSQEQLQANSELQKRIENLSKNNKRALSRSLRHSEGMIHLLQRLDKLAQDMNGVLVELPDNRDQIKETLKVVLSEIDTLYETAIVQRNLKQGQNALLEKKRALMKLQSACLETQRILQQQQ